MAINYLEEHNGVEHYNISLTVAEGQTIRMSDFFILLNELHSDGTLTLYQTDALYHACCAHINYGILPSAESVIRRSGFNRAALQVVTGPLDHPRGIRFSRRPPDP